MVAAWGPKQGEREGNVTLVLSELLRKGRKRLDAGLGAKQTLVIMSVNVGGSREALEWALEQDCAVLMIQEHRMLGNALHGIMNKAKWKGWTGVWEGAQARGKQSRSGRIATLVRSPVPIHRAKVGKEGRWHKVVVPWLNGIALHVYSVYGWVCGEGAEEKNDAMVTDLKEDIGTLGRTP